MGNEILKRVKIIYEDADCVVVDKPSGLMVHSDARNEGPFLTDWMVERYPSAAEVGEDMEAEDGSVMKRPGIVHRLDRETSGALIIAKTAAGHALLKGQFKDRTVAKTYLAFVWGELKEEFGTINRPIGKNGSDFRRWSAAGRGVKGGRRDAETYWTRLWTGQEDKERFSLVRAEPKTGRTHQIRVHMLAVHHPVVGDKLYAPNKPYALGFKRLALHSYSLEFTSPATGKPVKIVAPLPDDFQAAFKDLNIEPLTVL